MFQKRLSENKKDLLEIKRMIYKLQNSTEGLTVKVVGFLTKRDNKTKQKGTEIHVRNGDNKSLFKRPTCNEQKFQKVRLKQTQGDPFLKEY